MNMKILLVGIDGGDLSIIKKGVKKGILPTFQYLMNNGIYGELTSTTPPGTAPAWVSMTTGVNPGKHRIFDFIDWKSKRVINSSHIMCPTIWEIVDKYNITSVIVNVPITYPPIKINGVIVPGFPLPHKRISTWPNHVESLLVKKGYIADFGEYEALRYMVVNKEASLLNRVKDIIEKRTAVVLDLMSSTKWNFCMAVYTTLDRIQHVAFHKPNIVLEAYRIMDENMKKIIKNIDEETLVLVASDHGFMQTRKILYINEILRRAGLIRLAYGSLLMLMFYQSLLYLFLRGPQKILIAKVLEVLGRLGVTSNLLKFSRGEGLVIREEARALSSYGRYLYMDAKSEKAKRKLIAILKNLKARPSNNSIIEEIIPTSKIYKGPYVSRAPRLIVKLSPEYSAFTLIATPKVVIDVTRSLEPRTGKHKLNGILLAYSKKPFKQKSRATSASIYDVTSTVLALLNIPIPSWMDGKPIMSILRAIGQESMRLHTDENQRAVTEEKLEQVYSIEEEEDVKGRLKSLGYL